MISYIAHATLSMPVTNGIINRAGNTISPALKPPVKNTVIQLNMPSIQISAVNTPTNLHVTSAKNLFTYWLLFFLWLII